MAEKTITKKLPLQKRQRGIWLILFLLGEFYLHFITFAAIFHLYKRTFWQHPPPRVSLFDVLYQLLFLVSIVLIWQWKKWGMYGMALGFLITLGMNIYQGIQIIPLTFLAIHILLLFLVVYPKWKYLT